MGHNPTFLSFKLSINSEEILNSVNHHIFSNTTGDSYSPRSGIRFLKGIISDYDSAVQFLEKNDIYYDDCIAVKYKYYDSRTSKPSKKLLDLEEKRKDIYKKYYELNAKVIFKEFKSQYVGCKKCGSKLNKDYLRTNKCPLCGNDMRSETLLKQIESYKNKLESLDVQIADEKRKLAEKSGDMRWLVYFDYHT